MSLGYKDPLCAESKVSACFRLSLHEEAEYRRANRKAAIPGTLRMPDGSAHWKNAFHGAEAAAKKTGLKRWQVSRAVLSGLCISSREVDHTASFKYQVGAECTAILPPRRVPAAQRIICRRPTRHRDVPNNRVLPLCQASRRRQSPRLGRSHMVRRQA
jgi:hypothetical protein